MKTKRRIVITSQTSERFIVQWKKSANRERFCAVCVAEIEMLKVEEAAIVSGLTVREIFYRVESGAVHFLETKDGLMFVCLNSLELSSQNKNKY
jgi:hypothetical protein